MRGKLHKCQSRLNNNNEYFTVRVLWLALLLLKQEVQGLTLGHDFCQYA